MAAIAAHRVCNGSSPVPPRATIAEMVLELGLTLTETQCRPLALTVESWPTGRGQLYARIAVECEPGNGDRSFASWYQWQHPVWRWRAGAETARPALVLSPDHSRGQA